MTFITLTRITGEKCVVNLDRVIAMYEESIDDDKKGTAIYFTDQQTDILKETLQNILLKIKHNKKFVVLTEMKGNKFIINMENVATIADYRDGHSTLCFANNKYIDVSENKDIILLKIKRNKLFLSLKQLNGRNIIVNMLQVNKIMYEDSRNNSTVIFWGYYSCKEVVEDNFRKIISFLE